MTQWALFLTGVIVQTSLGAKFYCDKESSGHAGTHVQHARHKNNVSC